MRLRSVARIPRGACLGAGIERYRHPLLASVLEEHGLGRQSNHAGRGGAGALPHCAAPRTASGVPSVMSRYVEARKATPITAVHCFGGVMHTSAEPAHLANHAFWRKTSVRLRVSLVKRSQIVRMEPNVRRSPEFPAIGIIWMELSRLVHHCEEIRFGSPAQDELRKMPRPPSGHSLVRPGRPARFPAAPDSACSRPEASLFRRVGNSGRARSGISRFNRRTDPARGRILRSSL